MCYKIISGDEVWTLLAVDSGSAQGVLANIRCHCTACGATIGLDLDDNRTDSSPPDGAQGHRGGHRRSRPRRGGDAGVWHGSRRRAGGVCLLVAVDAVAAGSLPAIGSRYATGHGRRRASLAARGAGWGGSPLVGNGAQGAEALADPVVAVPWSSSRARAVTTSPGRGGVPDDVLGPPGPGHENSDPPRAG